MNEKMNASSTLKKNIFNLASDDFINNGYIPSEFTCDGKNISPSLRWADAPLKTKSFILTVKDPDAPGGVFTHWAVINIPPSVNGFKKGENVYFKYTQLNNDFGYKGYGGPCPPSNTHRYVFTIYAIDTDITNDVTDLDKEIDTHMISKAELTGLYKRN
jgi:Raf kinase inhibitor-like YbhB/YbcL family protein